MVSWYKQLMFVCLVGLSSGHLYGFGFSSLKAVFNTVQNKVKTLHSKLPRWMQSKKGTTALCAGTVAAGVALYHWYYKLRPIQTISCDGKEINVAGQNFMIPSRETEQIPLFTRKNQNHTDFLTKHGLLLSVHFDNQGNAFFRDKDRKDITKEIENNPAFKAELLMQQKNKAVVRFYSNSYYIKQVMQRPHNNSNGTRHFTALLEPIAINNSEQSFRVFCFDYFIDDREDMKYTLYTSEENWRQNRPLEKESPVKPSDFKKYFIKKAHDCPPVCTIPESNKPEKVSLYGQQVTIERIEPIATQKHGAFRAFGRYADGHKTEHLFDYLLNEKCDFEITESPLKPEDAKQFKIHNPKLAAICRKGALYLQGTPMVELCGAQYLIRQVIRNEDTGAGIGHPQRQHATMPYYKALLERLENGGASSSSAQNKLSELTFYIQQLSGTATPQVMAFYNGYRQPQIITDPYVCKFLVSHSQALQSQDGGGPKALQSGPQ